MSETTSTPAPKPVPNPSTYRQVIENMEKILNVKVHIDQLMESVGDVAELPLTIKDIAEIVKQLKILFLDPKDPGTGGDIVTTENGVKIIGVHVNTTNIDVDMLASDYPQGLTVELKSVGVIGLAGKPGMVHPYCFLFTMKKDSSIEGEPEDVDYVPMQVAFANDAMYLYSRFAAKDTGAWGGWKERQEQPQQDGHQQIVDSVSEPIGQREGDYWFQLLDKDPDAEPAEYTFETIAPPAETTGDELESVDADQLPSYDVM